MKRILITGATSYIGTSFERYIKENYSTDFFVDTIDMIDGSWRKYDFSEYDAVFHVAGIAHADTGNADEATKEKYYKVNTDLTIETAKKAKADGVRQFVFMSSIIVYGSKKEIITKDTVPCPDNFYGDSKLQADIRLDELNDDDFKVAIIRPPMVYGRNSKGNYAKLSRLAKKTFIFPKINNQRSMIYIGNLCEFIKLMIENAERGIFYPQNEDYVNVYRLVERIAQAKGKKLIGISWFNPVLRLLAKKISLFNKVFGTVVYDKKLSEYKISYQVVDFEQSIKETETEFFYGKV